jgi:hypothetical protein
MDGDRLRLTRSALLKLGVLPEVRVVDPGAGYTQAVEFEFNHARSPAPQLAASVVNGCFESVAVMAPGQSLPTGAPSPTQAGRSPRANK